VPSLAGTKLFLESFSVTPNTSSPTRGRVRCLGCRRTIWARRSSIGKRKDDATEHIEGDEEKEKSARAWLKYKNLQGDYGACIRRKYQCKSTYLTDNEMEQQVLDQDRHSDYGWKSQRDSRRLRVGAWDCKLEDNTTMSRNGILLQRITRYSVTRRIDRFPSDKSIQGVSHCTGLRP
jgi:hypothetical protein